MSLKAKKCLDKNLLTMVYKNSFFLCQASLEEDIAVMRIHFLHIAVLTIILICIPIVSSASHIECKDWAAKIVSVEGRVESLLAHETDWKEAKLNDTFCPEDRVRTLEKSRAAILLPNETILRLDQKTVVKFSFPAPKKPTLLDLIIGRIFFMSRTPQALTIETPFVNAASEGTEFSIEVNEEDRSTTIIMIEGRVAVTNEAGTISIKSGQSAITKAGQKPILGILVRPQDAIQWALYYPPIFSIRDLRLGEIEGELRSMMRGSIDSYMEGDIEKAFSTIEKVPENIRDQRFYTYRASLLLSVGQVDEANQNIQKALDLVSNYSPALALQSIIALVRNEKDQAIRFALEAIRAGPDSVSARIALSYAYQANFNLPEALVAAKEATNLDPENSLAWARLAELLMAEGNLDKALDAAKMSVVINPKEARAQVVLGFAYLAQIKTKDSKKAFEEAITLNQADPLSRLGLGLAMIREGDLEKGRKEIEIAASLDPTNSLIRSYLGKAYYEEKRDKLAEVQLDMAKDFDPKDPTPYLYDAIRKQTENRPVEALHDLQKSIELNDNRAIYRSRLLLDHDTAARSVSLARIYDDLGFRQLALVEGFKSVSIDPANYSVHRFLADSFGALPRSEIARLSELLQAQLLQPININPVQPRLGESSPAILSGAGPVDTSFNEFSQLFNRDRVQLLTSGIVGENGTLGEEVILTGLYDRYSWSIGQLHQVTDGFRENADIDHDIYNVFTQVSLTHNLSIQGEIRSNDTENGDIDLRFDPDNFSPTLTRKRDTEAYRLGLHHALTPRQDIIASVFYQDTDEDLDDRSPVGRPPTARNTAKAESKGFSGEVQYLFRTERFNLIAGGGHFDGDTTTDLTIVLGLPSPPFPPPITRKIDSDIRHTNLHTYLLINFSYNATLTIGGSGDLFDGLPRDNDQFNPKFGLAWNPLPSTTLRVAAFRVLKRSLISNQTIEPTQVAGFQQFFDDTNGTDSRRYGIAIDQRVSLNLFGGLEVSRRDLEIPVVPLTSTASNEVDAEQRLGRAYLYWIPFAWVAARTEYQYERFDSNDPIKSIEIAPKIKTHRVPLGLNFYHPCGFFAKLLATYIDQEALFRDVPVNVFIIGQDQFWIIDTSIGYRLPKRLGIFTIEAKNLFDQNFKFHETDLLNPSIQPARLVFTKLTLSF